MSKMFPFITTTWNPLGGECLHYCSYCWAKDLIAKYSMPKYMGPPKIIVKELNRQFKETDFVFVSDMCDLFGHWVPSDMIQRILGQLGFLSQAQFLLLTKNPARYLEFDLPSNAVAGATIESDRNFELTGPPQMSRIETMRKLKHKRKFVSVEPIMMFDQDFPYEIASIHPEFIAVGYDNYNHGLREPSLSETEGLISVCEDFGIKVYRKTIREKHAVLDCEKEQQDLKQGRGI